MPVKKYHTEHTVEERKIIRRIADLSKSMKCTINSFRAADTQIIKLNRRKHMLKTKAIDYELMINELKKKLDDKKQQKRGIYNGK